jgi:hypothetical protein
MAVGMIGGPRLCEPLLATGLGRFTGGAREQARSKPIRIATSSSAATAGSRTSGASQRATTNSLGTTSRPSASLPPWHSGFNQLSLDPGHYSERWSLVLEILNLEWLKKIHLCASVHDLAHN